MAKRISCQGMHREFGNFAKTQGNLIGQSCKFPDSYGKGYCDICREISIFSQLFVCFVYVLFTNYVNWHRENLRLDRENTGKTQGKHRENTGNFENII